jgi:hypothetical protein
MQLNFLPPLTAFFSSFTLFASSLILFFSSLFFLFFCFFGLLVTSPREDASIVVVKGMVVDRVARVGARASQVMDAKWVIWELVVEIVG